MRHAVLGLTFGAVLLVLECPAVSAQPASGSEQEVLKLERELTAAWSKNDDKALDRLLADDYTYTDHSGRSGTKTQSLTDLRQGKGRESGAVSTDGYRAKVYGDTAIVTHVTTLAAPDGKTSAQVQTTHVWIRRDGRWQLVSHQSTPVAFPEKARAPFLSAKCAKYSFEPEVYQFFGNSASIITKLDGMDMGLADRTGYMLLIETETGAELFTFDRTTWEEPQIRVASWSGPTLGDFRETLANAILNNQGIACVGQQTRRVVKARFNPTEIGNVPCPQTAREAFSHMIKKYGAEYVRATVVLLC